MVYLETPRKTVLQHRKATIPPTTLEKMYRFLDMPLREEAHEVVYVRRD
jgi:hypothetical protein